ncbi:hypothetical protein [Actinospica sp.]|uniref:hypothetical protein n=1 Tax=Actinospica sp. TaxID=1872142 RepID=UPI002BD87FDF|nr:hypothetical protein [Actinospica sp.]HWG23769.1 hypothetical protein [Actinospica sp.]
MTAAAAISTALTTDIACLHGLGVVLLWVIGKAHRFPDLAAEHYRLTPGTVIATLTAPTGVDEDAHQAEPARVSTAAGRLPPGRLPCRTGVKGR